MTDDQRARLNRFLAERVMEWEVRNGYLFIKGSHVSTDRSSYSYQPSCSWADCEPLLDKIERDGWKWIFDNVTDGGYGGHVWRLPHSGHGWSKASRTEALCLAIARCYGWKEEP